jgi:hypothetical protein
MGNKISQLTPKAATIADTDLVEVSQSAGGGTYVTRSVTGANIKALVTDANLVTSDITTNNVSTLKHGFAPKLPGNTTTFLRGDGTYATPAAGGLTEFTEAENTAAPNATVPVNSLTPVTATTNADFAIIPKGNGALIAAIPDNTAAGGNKRGQYAVDLSWEPRYLSNEVASGKAALTIGRSQTGSGNHSVCIGDNNRATGTGSIAIGSAITTSGNYSICVGSGTVSGGSSASFGNNTVSGTYSLAVGNGNTVSRDTSTALGEQNNIITAGAYSFAHGAYNTVTNSHAYAFGYENQANGRLSAVFGRLGSSHGVIGRFTWAPGRLGATGDSQYSLFVIQTSTTDATATTLVSNIVDSGTTPGTTNQVILPNNSGYRFKGTIVGKKSGTTDVAAWDIDGLIVRGANAAATTLVVSNVNVVDNTPAWGTPTLAADTTNGGLRVQVIGAASTNIRWTATIETTEIIYA